MHQQHAPVPQSWPFAPLGGEMPVDFSAARFGEPPSPRLDCDLDRIKRGDLNRLGKLHAINPEKLRKEYPQSSATGTYARRSAADRGEYRQAAGFASEIKRALNQGLIESVTYDRGAIFFDAHLGSE
jgi:hypothetical protein